MKRRMLSLLLCVVMTLSMLTFCVLPASAVTNPYPTIQYVGGVATLPCTNYAWQQAYDRLGVTLPDWGNAINWYNRAANAGYSVGSTPRANSIAVWSMEPMHSLGHVAFVTAVNGSNMTINESGRIDHPETNGIVNGQVVSSVVGTTCFEGRYLIGFIYLSNESAFTYTNISGGNYFLRNVKNCEFLCVDNGIDQSGRNVHTYNFANTSAFMMNISARSTGYAIRPLCCSSRLVNPDGVTVTSPMNVNIYDDVNDSSEWWRFQKVDGGYVIHNVQNANCVLGVDENDNVLVSTYKQGNTSQIWQLGPVSDVPAKPVYTCTSSGNTLNIQINNYKSTEYHDIYIRDASNEVVYTKINIGGSSHSVTLNEGDYKVEVWAVNKAVGMYTAGDRTNVVIKDEPCTHILDEGIIVDTPATCGKAGVGHKNCIICNEVAKANIVIPATGKHSWNAGVVTKQPTATSTGVKTYTCTVCSATKNETIPAISVSAVRKFTDVQKKDWYYKAVEYAVNNNLFSGLTETDFGPNENMTRGMFVTVLGRLHGVSVSKKVSTKFVDVKKNQYYTGYVKWANDNNIVSGLTTTTFGPEENINREQICAMMVRYCSYAKITLQKKNAAITFKDGAKISKFARSAVKACQQGGIVNGEKVSGGYNFRPQGNATRAEVATIMMNFAKAYK